MTTTTPDEYALRFKDWRRKYMSDEAYYWIMLSLSLTMMTGLLVFLLTGIQAQGLMHRYVHNLLTYGPWGVLAVGVLMAVGRWRYGPGRDFRALLGVGVVLLMWVALLAATFTRI